MDVAMLVLALPAPVAPMASAVRQQGGGNKIWLTYEQGIVVPHISSAERIGVNQAMVSAMAQEHRTPLILHTRREVVFRPTLSPSFPH